MYEKVFLWFGFENHFLPLFICFYFSLLTLSVSLDKLICCFVNLHWLYLLIFHQVFAEIPGRLFIYQIVHEKQEEERREREWKREREERHQKNQQFYCFVFFNCFTAFEASPLVLPCSDWDLSPDSIHWTSLKKTSLFIYGVGGWENQSITLTCAMLGIKLMVKSPTP